MLVISLQDEYRNWISSYQRSILEASDASVDDVDFVNDGRQIYVGNVPVGTLPTTLTRFA